MKRATFSILFCALLCVGLTSCNDKYNDILVKKVREVLGPDYKAYQSFSYPTNNFGLATAYAPRGGEEKPYDSDFLCDGWSCIGVKDTDIPQDLSDKLRMKGFAAVGGDGAQITLTESEAKELGLNIVLPRIYEVLKISGGFDSKQVIKTELTIDRAYPRKLRRPAMISYLNSLPDTDPIKTAFTQGNLVLIVADVVIGSIRVIIDVDKHGAQTLDGALGGNLPGVGKVFTDTALGVKVSRQLTGKYTFEITKPVIVLRLAKRQPEAGTLASQEDWDDWSNISVPLPQLEKP